MSNPKLPPGQQLAAPGKWPLVGERQPAPPPETWSLTITGCVESPATWTLAELLAMPQVERWIDIHCVTRWSKLQAKFRGVLLTDLLKLVRPTPLAQFVSFIAHSTREHSTSTSLADAVELETLVALAFDDQPLTIEHGGPVRTVVPHRYFYKSVKWLRRIELLSEDRLGFWEASAGYHNHADPMFEERFVAPKISKQESRQILDQRDISGRELMGIDGSQRDLTGLMARDSLLRNANFQRAQLQRACFDRANLSNAKFQAADLRGTTFVGADLEGADFCDADLRRADLRGASLFGTTFVDDTIKDATAKTQIDSTTQIDLESIAALAPIQAEFVRRCLSLV